MTNRRYKECDDTRSQNILNRELSNFGNVPLPSMSDKLSLIETTARNASRRRRRRSARCHARCIQLIQPTSTEDEEQIGRGWGFVRTSGRLTTAISSDETGSQEPRSRVLPETGRRYTSPASHTHHRTSFRRCFPSWLISRLSRALAACRKRKNGYVEVEIKKRKKKRRFIYPSWISVTMDGNDP